MEVYLERLKRELMIRGYSLKTFKAYRGCIRDYFNYCDMSKVELVDVDDIKNFLFIKKSEGKAPSTLNLYLNAIKFFYKQVLGLGVVIDGIKFSKKPNKLPVVLSKDEVKRIIVTVINPKHRLLLALAYGAGLRVSEVVRIRVGDICFDDGYIRVCGGKGNKDRVTLLPGKLIDDLRFVVSVRGVGDFVFESSRGGRLSERTAQKIFEFALGKSGVCKFATFHSLRHSFATHLLESGVNLLYIKDLLGHRDLKTTQIYAKVTMPGLLGVKSPLG